MTRKLQLIVEGDGDVLAVPVLVRRILEGNNIFDAAIANPVQKRGDLPKVRRRFSDFFQAATFDMHPILCVLDFDCADCRDVLSEEQNFRNMAASLRPGYPFQACFIVKEYESIFLSDPETTPKCCRVSVTTTRFPRIQRAFVTLRANSPRHKKRVGATSRQCTKPN